MTVVGFSSSTQYLLVTPQGDVVVSYSETDGRSGLHIFVAEKNGYVYKLDNRQAANRIRLLVGVEDRSN